MQKNRIGQTIGYVALTFALGAVLGAIWTSEHWQWGLTAIVLSLVGAGVLGNISRTEREKNSVDAKMIDAAKRQRRSPW